MGLVNYVRSHKKINALGAQVMINSNWNLQLAYQLAESRHDKEVVKFLTYGWPLNHDGSKTTVTLRNHKSAEQFPAEVTAYITREVGAG